MAREAVDKHGISIRLACECMGISETCYRYHPLLSDENAEIADWLVRLTASQRNWGFGLCYLFLRNVKGYRWNHKRVYRIHRELGLNLRIKPKKRLVREKPIPLAEPTAVNECWSMDFVYDQLEYGRSYRLFNVLDDFNREGLRIEVDLSLPAERVIRALDQVIEWHRMVGQSPERCGATTARSTTAARSRHGHQSARSICNISNPASPSRTPTSSDTIGPCGYDWLAQYLFEPIEQVEEFATRRIWTYNNECPNMGLEDAPQTEVGPRGLILLLGVANNQELPVVVWHGSTPLER